MAAYKKLLARGRHLLLYQVGTKAALALGDQNGGQIFPVRRANLTSIREAMTCFRLHYTSCFSCISVLRSKEQSYINFCKVLQKPASENPI